ncbi:MAG: prolyl aminopeptidase [Gammaproteobacteria bacterium]|nr:prolyl aminopeptidase [Gammaproteobacteria bacterium]
MLSESSESSRPAAAAGAALYPPREAHRSGLLEVGGGHRVYCEESGAPAGLPAVFLHGGPGSGAKPDHRRYFCPRRYRLAIFDQRGSGRSLPASRLEYNTTQALVEDMEAVRLHFGIERWLVYGGSWGATLALAYAETHPEHVLGLILRGSFLARRRDVDWVAGGGAEQFFPDDWQRLLQALPEAERGDPLAALAAAVLEGGPERRLQAARAWADWSGRVVTWNLPAGGEGGDAEEDTEELLRRARVEMHYARHGYFLREGQILADLPRLPKVPVTLIHGRRDLTCLPSASWELHRALPMSELVFVPEAGHLASEPAMAQALLAATDRMAEILA